MAANISVEIGKKRTHLNVRLPILEDYGLVQKIGPAESSGLYEITETGKIALRHREQYDSADVDFDELVERELENVE
nr:hypothetical protein [Haladaptatus cibarius]